MNITVTRRAPRQSPDKIPKVMAAARLDSLTHPSKTVAAASRPGRPLRERSPHAKANRS